MSAVTADRFDPVLLEVQRMCERVDLGHLAWRSLTASHQYLPALDELTAAAPAPASVLDWGAGYGVFSRALLDLGYTVTAYDVFDDMPTYAELRASGRWTYEQSTDPIRLPFADAQFDVVTSIGVLEHVGVTGGEDLAALREVRRVLKPDGVFLCSHLPNRHSWIEAVARRLHRGHVFRYDRQDITRLTEQSGLSVEKVWRQGMLPRNTTSKFTVSQSPRVARAFDRIDLALTRSAGRFAQNWGFVARPSGA